MLHNRVSILKWLNIHPFYSIVESYWPMCIWWNYFQWDYVTNLYQHHLLYCSSPGALNFFFFLLVEMFEVDRRNGRGHLYFGVDIILVKHHVNQQWVQTGWLVPSWAELTTMFPSMTVLFVFGQKWERPERRSSPSSRTFTIGLIHASLQPWQ